MAEDSKIQWTDATFNPWRGCTKVSAGCANCYAEALSGRNPKTLGVWGPKGTRVVTAEATWREPVRWNRLAAEGKLPDGTPNPDGHRPRVFCASLADVFEGPETMPAEAVPRINEARARLFSLIQDTPNLDWLLLTKRPQNFVKVLRAALDTGKLRISETKRGPKHWNVVDWLHERNCPPNVWIGTSVENQAAAESRVRALVDTPAAVRFLSCEPLIGPVNLTRILYRGEWWNPLDTQNDLAAPYLDWVIVGCESGRNRRPMDEEWAASLVEQCRTAGVECFVKQVESGGRVTGQMEEFPQQLRVRRIPEREARHG